MSFTVGQLAKLTGLTVRALHHYDAIGLLVPSQRSEAGYRLYAQKDVAKLFRIQALQGVGLSLSEVEQALSRGAALPDLIAQQLATLEEQIEHASALRDRLTHLQSILQRGEEPAAGDWVEAVELMTQYGKYCSTEELQRLIAHRNDNAEAWRKFVVDLDRALQINLAPTSHEAKSLLDQWMHLLLSKVGGDLSLAIKMKLAHVNDRTLQARLEAQGGVTIQMMEYLSDVALQVHTALWAKHLAPSDVRRLPLQDTSQSKLLPTIGALLQATREINNAAATAAALQQWHALLDSFSGHDETLRRKVEAALLADAELARMWLIDDELRPLLLASRGH